MKHQTRIMYIENKGNDGIVGDAKIGRVTILNNGKSLRYQGKQFSSLRGKGFKSNYYDLDTHEYYWISGCRKDGRDALYSTNAEIDEDIREEYWTQIRKMPEMKNVSVIKVLSISWFQILSNNFLSFSASSPIFNIKKSAISL